MYVKISSQHLDQLPIYVSKYHGMILLLQCTLNECGDEEWNNKEAGRFKLRWGHIGQRFQCYVNTDNANQVILNRATLASVLHALFWPFLGLFIGFILWIGLCCGCCVVTQEEIREPTYGLLWV